MAAQSKTTAVHFSLIIFVMLSVILGVVALLFYNDYRGQQANLEETSTQLTQAQSSVRTMGEEITGLKSVIGIDAEEVGSLDGGPGEKTVIGQAQDAITTFGTNPSEPSFLAAMQDLREDYNNATKQLEQSSAEIASLQATVQSLEGKYANTAQVNDEKRAASEQDLSTEQAKFAETIVAKDQEIDELRNTIGQLQAELDQTTKQAEAQLAKNKKTITDLLNTVRLMRDELDAREGMSFEVADGEIRNVDQVGRTVWINLGSKDGLKERVTFSIYKKRNAGFGVESQTGGRPEDIKGKIEVTEITGPKMAKARILGEWGGRPIAPGDPIYTPLWGAGRTESFAFAGGIDIDGDGSFQGDRERLHQIIEANGSEISAELLPSGERRGGEIDHNTRFLVMGHFPKPEEATPDEQAKLQELVDQQGRMRTEAEANGVRIISLNSFLDFIGFVPQRNVFVPGESESWKLKSGSPARPDRSSGGSTSSLFKTDRNGPARSGE